MILVASSKQDAGLLPKCKKFRATREFWEEQDATGKTLAVMAAVPVVTVLIDTPETLISVGEDVCEGISRAWGSIFD